MKSYSNGLSAAQEERLHLLVEECSEVIKAAAKALRHGYRPTDHSVDPPAQYDNKADLEMEVGQVMSAAKMMCKAFDLDAAEIQRHFDERDKKVRQYLHHQ